jgi:hypothetical protein
MVRGKLVGRLRSNSVGNAENRSRDDAGEHDNSLKRTFGVAL